MTQAYFMKLTDAGAQALAAEQAGGDLVSLSHMAVGDGSDGPVGAPTGSESALAGEVFRDTLTSLGISAADAQTLEAELVIPPETGGWAIREVGVFMSDGTLFAYGNFPETYKPTVGEGSTRDMRIVAAIKVGSADSVNLVIDPNFDFATQSFVLNSQTVQDRRLRHFIYFAGQF